MGRWRKMMSGRGSKERGEEEVVMVAIDGSKEITDYALEWAIRNVVQPHDRLILLALLPPSSSSSSSPLRPPSSSNNQTSPSLVPQFLSSLFRRRNSQRGTDGSRESLSEKSNHGSGKGVESAADMSRISKVCLEMMNDLCWGNNLKNVRSQVELIPSAPKGSVAEQAEEYRATWVILDRRLKREGEGCLQRLKYSNIIIVDHAIPHVLKLINPSATEESISVSTSTSTSTSTSQTHDSPGQSSTTISSSSSSSLSQHTSASSTSIDIKHKIPKPLTPPKGKANPGNGEPQRRPHRISVDLLQTAPRRHPTGGVIPARASVDRTPSVRRAASLSARRPPPPPPLCSVCKHPAPAFGRPPRKFSYAEMEAATDGFSAANFLAEGGYGPVYRGVLADGQAVAVKQHRGTSAQGAAEFCSEVEVLSCAQHRNVVMLVGYCMDKQWLLIYELACNGSLDKHLYGNGMKEVMAWHFRQKVAVGAARGLRYLHEDCRVGCIVHRDLRPNNILLTHDFEPMVGDFGLARWQVNGQSAEETRVVGTFGYLAPEYTQTGLITEKADVYAFGVLLLELISGLKAVDLARCIGQEYLPQWARLLIQKDMMFELIDPRLNGSNLKREIDCMIYAASLCISLDPEKRPRMSKVLAILEGEMPTDVAATKCHNLHRPPVIKFPSTYAQLSNPFPLNDIKLVKKRDEVMMEPIQKHMDQKTKMDLGNSRWFMKQNEPLESKEYQAHLQELLTKFICKANGFDSSKTRALRST